MKYPATSNGACHATALNIKRIIQKQISLFAYLILFLPDFPDFQPSS